MIPIRVGFAVADDIEAELALWRLDAVVGFAFRRAQGIAALAALNLALWNVAQRLLQNFDALPRFQDANVVAGVDVALRQRRDVEVKAVVDAVGLGLADVVGNARRANLRAADAEGNQVFGRQVADAATAGLDNLVVADEPVQLVQRAGDAVVGQILARSSHPSVRSRMTPPKRM